MIFLKLFCIKNDFAKHFAKCRNLFKYFVSHTMIIFRNDTSPLLDKELDDEGNHPCECFQNSNNVE